MLRLPRLEAAFTDHVISAFVRPAAVCRRVEPFDRPQAAIPCNITPPRPRDRGSILVAAARRGAATPAARRRLLLLLRDRLCLRARRRRVLARRAHIGDPFAVEHLLRRQPLLRVLLKQAIDHLTARRLHVRQPRVRLRAAFEAILDAQFERLDVRCHKARSTDTHLVNHRPKSPHVNRLAKVAIAANQDLRSHVIERAFHALCLLLLGRAAKIRKAKIAKTPPLPVVQHVARLDVAMGHAQAVNVLQSRADLRRADDGVYLVHRHLLLAQLLQLRVERAAAAIVEARVDRAALRALVLGD